MRAWTDRRSTRVVLALAALGLLATAAFATAASVAYGSERVKYYLVTAGAGGDVETLPDIARRLLGDEDRAADIHELNEGRPQPDGGTLTADGTLRVGWVLVLPWDAVGDGVRYGELDPPSATGAPTTTETATNPNEPTSPGGGSCPELPPLGTAGEPWAQRQLAPQDAWLAAGRGSGVVVAVVDSGVDASVPQLAGRVSAGVDVVTGTDSGAIDCLGTGTAMAALIVADDPQVRGIAPDATVVPIRVTVDEPAATATDQATAIDVAVSAGAGVVALGSSVDVSLPGVRQAITNAARHDVVVVVAGPVTDDGSLPPQLLRVGVLNSSGDLAQDYRPGTIDLVAPGQEVASFGPASQGQVQVSGGQYAVALVAGAAALVRGAAPELGADDVVEHLTGTATPLEPEGASEGQAIAAVVNPAEAVLAAAPDATSTVAPGDGAEDQSGMGTVLVSAAILLLLLLSGLLLLRGRRAPQSAGADPPQQSTVDET